MLNTAALYLNLSWFRAIHINTVHLYDHLTPSRHSGKGTYSMLQHARTSFFTQIVMWVLLMILMTMDHNNFTKQHYLASICNEDKVRFQCSRN
jgi:hypothetical protein